MQPTALAHGAYLRIVDWRRMSLRNRAQFFGLAAQMMRHILVHHARAPRISAAVIRLVSRSTKRRSLRLGCILRLAADQCDESSTVAT